MMLTVAVHCYDDSAINIIMAISILLLLLYNFGCVGCKVVDCCW